MRNFWSSRVEGLERERKKKRGDERALRHTYESAHGRHHCGHAAGELVRASFDARMMLFSLGKFLAALPMDNFC